MVRHLAFAAALLFALPVQAQTVVLVRHAEKAAAPAADPPLTNAGRARAQALSDRIGAARVSAILTSHLARTRETAAALSARTGVPVTVIPIEQSAHEHLAATVALARRAPVGSTVVIVGHSNTVPLLARALGWPSPPEIADCEYGLMFELDLSRPQPTLTPSRYGAPSAC